MKKKKTMSLSKQEYNHSRKYQSMKESTIQTKYMTKDIYSFPMQLALDYNFLTLINKKVILTYLLTYLLTPWCVIFEKLIVKKYPAFLWNLKVHHCVHKSPSLDPILS
jgi:hypothetical protein